MARQKQIGWNKWVGASLLSALLLVGGLLFFSPQASAAATYEWTSPNPPTIHATDFAGQGASMDFACTKSGSGYTCTQQNDSDQCPNKIVVGNDATTGKLTTQGYEPVQHQCTPGSITNQTITLGHTGNAPTDLGNRDPADTGSADSTDNTDATDPNLECHVTKNPLTWFLCPFIKGLNGTINQLDDAINSLLKIEQAKIFDTHTDTGKGYYGAWQTFRSFALAILLIGGLIMIIAQALGFEILDAYTIKKILPRLIVAIIGIALSWEIMKFFVILTNDLGEGVRQVIYYPFRNLPNHVELGGGGQVAANLIGATAIGALGIVGLLSFVVTGAMAVVVAFLVLILRQLVIVLLVLFAPIAIACFILPNTQNIFKLWHESFTKAMMMFPIIVAFLAIGRIFAITSIGSNVGNAPAISQLVGFAAYFLPYFLIPMTFRLAGGAMRTLGGAVNDRSRGGFDRLKKFRQGQFQEYGGRHMRNTRNRMFEQQANFNDKMIQRGSKVNPHLGKAGNWARRKAFLGAGGFVSGPNVEAKMSARRAEEAKRMNDQIATGRDEEARALTVNKGWALTQAEATKKADGTWTDGQWRMNDGKRQFKTLGGAWVDEGYVDRAQSRWGRDTFAQQAALSYEMRKASTEDDFENLAQNYHHVAEGWHMTDGEAGGTWTGAAFENQNQNLAFKKTDWKTGTMTQNQQRDFLSEIYEKRGSYPMAQMSGYTIKQIRNAHADAVRRGDVATQQKTKAIAETFMTRYGGGAAGSDDPATQAALQARQGAPGQRVDSFQTNTPGAASVAEQVRKLAVETGVYQPLPDDTYTTSQNPGGPGNPAPPVGTGPGPLPPYRGPRQN